LLIVDTATRPCGFESRDALAQLISDLLLIHGGTPYAHERAEHLFIAYSKRQKAKSGHPKERVKRH
jgi:hypothetical protein